MAYSDVRQGLAKVITDRIPNLTVYLEDPDHDLEYPCLVIGQFAEYDYNPILELGGFHAELLMVLYVYSMSTREAMDDIEDYRWPNGSKSLFLAVNQDNTLDGSVNHAWIRRTGSVVRDRDNLDRLWEYSTEFTLQITHSVGV